MNVVRSFTTQGMCLATILAFLAVLSATPNRASAQEGYNAVCASTACTGIGTGIVASSAFIDASAFCSTSGDCSHSDDFCVVVNTALTKLPLAGGVVDARGVMTQSGTYIGTTACSSTTTPTPFTGITTPSTVLLPAGKITIHQTWILPDRTRIIGEGNNPENGTWITVAASGFTGSSMIQMGTSSCNDSGSDQCYGIAVEYVYLDGGGSTYANLIGILNQYAGPSSYVDHVNFAVIGGTGLVIGSNATDSGPYANLAMSPAGNCTSTTSCVHLGDSTYGVPLSTRGVHGLTCTCTGAETAGGTGTAGIALNSSNNTLEDIHFEGFIDGIRVGSLVPATGTIQTQGNVVLNVNGGDNNKDTMTNIIHICAPSTCGNTNNTSNTVSDVTILGAFSSPYSGSNANVILDDLTGTTIGTSSPTTVGMYVLGDQLSSAAYSRFATNTASPVPTWGVWDSPPSTSTSCQSGSLFSNTGGTSGGGGTGNYTLWVCSGSTWTKINH